jgi:LysM repeat protein
MTNMNDLLKKITLLESSPTLLMEALTTDEKEYLTRLADELRTHIDKPEIAAAMDRYEAYLSSQAISTPSKPARAKVATKDKVASKTPSSGRSAQRTDAATLTMPLAINATPGKPYIASSDINKRKQDIARANKLLNNTLTIGKKIGLPDGSLYTVLAGDTLSSIAALSTRGGTVPSISQAHPITDETVAAIVDDILTATDSPATDERMLLKSLKKIKSREMFIKIDAAYGAKHKSTIKQALDSDLDGGEREYKEIANIMKTFGQRLRRDSTKTESTTNIAKMLVNSFRF